MKESTALVSIIMGSTSDYQTMQHAEKTLQELKIQSETLIISAHRTPDRMYDYAKNAQKRGIKVIIAGAGGAAHLPGMVASMTLLPVLAVPVYTLVCGIDSLLSIVQMPKGTPVATFAIGQAGAQNAAIFASQILGLSNTEIYNLVKERKANQTKSIPINPSKD